MAPAHQTALRVNAPLLVECVAVVEVEWEVEDPAVERDTVPEVTLTEPEAEFEAEMMELTSEPDTTLLELAGTEGVELETEVSLLDNGVVSEATELAPVAETDGTAKVTPAPEQSALAVAKAAAKSLGDVH